MTKAVRQRKNNMAVITSKEENNQVSSSFSKKKKKSQYQKQFCLSHEACSQNPCSPTLPDVRSPALSDKGGESHQIRNHHNSSVLNKLIRSLSPLGLGASFA